MNEDYKEPNDDWFFHNPRHFPWDIMGLDRPMVGPVHSYIAKIISKYERDPGVRNYLSGSPHWGSIQHFATTGDSQDRNENIVLIYQYCSKLYDLRNESRRNTEYEVLNFLESYRDFRAEFAAQLLYLWKQDRLNLKPEMLRRKRVIY